LKFKLDENLPAALAAMLRDSGHDVDDVIDEGLAGEDDVIVLEHATNADRVLLTFDVDFADIRAFPPGTHAGNVVFRLNDQRWKQLQKSARRFLKETSLEKIANGLAIVDETRIRYKRPREKG
jgi:predicted nuclease of predicted toxin-antitoxin system